MRKGLQSHLNIANHKGRGDKRHDVQIGELALFFSYETCMAFSHPDVGLVVSENCWSLTTGWHLNEIDGGRIAQRVSRGGFEQRLTRLLQEYNLIPREE